MSLIQWTFLWDSDITQIMSEILDKFPSRTLKTTLSGTFVRQYDLPDGSIVGSYFKSGYLGHSFIANSPDIEASKEIILSEFWKIFQDKSFVLSHSDVAVGNGPENRKLVITYDEDRCSLSSEPARQQIRHLQRFLDAGIHRSILYYGPPGTGKSTLIRNVVKTLGVRSMRISIDELESIQKYYFKFFVMALKPDCIIIDDVDRLSVHDSMLDILEFLKDNVKFFVCSANKLSSIDAALLRPGRFDELVPIVKLDDAVILSLLGDEFKDSFEQVKDWPIAYIEEFKIRSRFMDKEEAQSSINELRARVKKLKGYYDEVDGSEVDEEESQSDKTKHLTIPMDLLRVQ
jgi:hypothetical protein